MHENAPHFLIKVDMMKDKKQFWTLRYSIINATYFATFCGVHMYASYYLLAKGFSNTTIGLMLALANVLSVVIQPFVAGFIDKPGKMTNRNVTIFSLTIIMIMTFLLYIVREQKAFIFVVYALIYMIQMICQPLIIAMSFEYEGMGCKMNFGFARSMGSAGFALFSSAMGSLLSAYDMHVLMLAEILMFAICIIFLIGFKAPSNQLKEVQKNTKVEAVEEHAENTVDDVGEMNTADNNTMMHAHNNLLEFAKYYPKFMLFIVASSCFFFAHNMINDFLIQIITPLGGTERELGLVGAMPAILELPTMIFFVYMTKYISCQKLLKISGVFFLVKTLILLAATSMGLVYISCICQIGAYALFIPASAYFVNIVMEDLDKVKGQAFVNCAITVGGVFSNLICGRVLDHFGPKIMLIIGCIVCLLGVVIAMFSIEEKKQVVSAI